MTKNQKISIIIPVRDEERYLPACLLAINHSLAKANVAAELVIVLNRCTDHSEAIARAAGATIIREDAKNLAIIRNAGARASTGNILIFIDADSRMHVKTIFSVLQRLSLSSVVGGGVMMFPERYSLGILLTFLCLLPFVVFDRISGGLFFVRRNDFDAVGGFDETFVTVEDIDFARRLKAFGALSERKFLTLWTRYIITSTRKFDTLGDWYFLKNPKMFIRLFDGKNRQLADKVWYDFKR